MICAETRAEQSTRYFIYKTRNVVKDSENILKRVMQARLSIKGEAKKESPLGARMGRGLKMHHGAMPLPSSFVEGNLAAFDWVFKPFVSNQNSTVK